MHTMRLWLPLMLIPVLALSFSARAQEGPTSEEASRIRESITVLNEVMTTSDTAIPASIAAKAEGIAIFPGTLKGGFIFGGMRGRGILSARTEGGWSAVIKVPQLKSEEQLVLELLDKDDVLVHPGYFFDFATEAPRRRPPSESWRPPACVKTGCWFEVLDRPRRGDSPALPP